MQSNQQKDKLIRRQFMLSVKNIEKLEAIARSNSSSVSEVVRLAIDNYNPDLQENSALMELVSTKLEETIEGTRNTRKRLNKALNSME